MGESIHIRALGADFSIQTDQEPEYVESLVEYIKEKARIIEQSAGLQDNVRSALLVSLLVTDELFRERRGKKIETSESQDDLLALQIIKKIDAVLDGDR